MNTEQKKKVADHFFLAIPGKEDTHRCINSEFRQAKASGKGNLVNHAVRKHNEACQLVIMDPTQRILNLAPTISAKAKNLYSWIDWITHEGLPFCQSIKKLFASIRIFPLFPKNLHEVHATHRSKSNRKTYKFVA